jgi:hypothetical protein
MPRLKIERQSSPKTLTPSIHSTETPTNSDARQFNSHNLHLLSGLGKKAEKLTVK